MWNEAEDSAAQEVDLQGDFAEVQKTIVERGIRLRLEHLSESGKPYICIYIYFFLFLFHSKERVRLS
jgi:hypothetical protein